jgi:hypothetical protein
MVGARAAARCGGVAAALLSVASCQWIGNITELQLTDSGAGVGAGDTDAGLQVPADAAAAADGAVAGGSWCATLSPAPAACADFDESESLPIGWRIIPQAAGDASVTIDLDAQAAYSPPGSLLVQVPPLGANPEAFAYAGIIASFSSGPSSPSSPFSHVQVELEYRAAQNTDDKIVEIDPLDSGKLAVSLVVNSAINGNDVALQQALEDGGYSSSPVGEISGEWIKITLSIELPDDGGPPYAIVLIGDAGTVQPLSALPPANEVDVRVGGIYVLQSPNGWSANFDNVAVYVK